MMNYEDFKEYVKNNILEELPDVYREFEVTIRKTMKNNGLELDGLLIHGHDNIAPVIYLNGYYEQYNDGASLENVMSEISNTYRANAEHRSIPDDILTTFDDFNNAKDLIFSKIVNTENNKELLSDRPHTEFEDLSVTYHVLISKDATGMASSPITNDMAEKFGVTAKELDMAANENMARNNPMVITSMYDMMKDMMIPDMMAPGMSREEAEEMFNDMVPSDGMDMYVLTNESKINGAVWMTNVEALDVAAERIGGDFFLLPSSVHECILVPKNGFDEKELQNMVMTVNQSQVSPEDRLSDNVYSYDSKEHKLSLVTGNMAHEQSLDHTMDQKHSAMAH